MKEIQALTSAMHLRDRWNKSSIEYITMRNRRSPLPIFHWLWPKYFLGRGCTRNFFCTFSCLKTTITDNHEPEPCHHTRSQYCIWYASRGYQDKAWKDGICGRCWSRAWKLDCYGINNNKFWWKRTWSYFTIESGAKYTYAVEFTFCKYMDNINIFVDMASVKVHSGNISNDVLHSGVFWCAWSFNVLPTCGSLFQNHWAVTALSHSIAYQSFRIFDLSGIVRYLVFNNYKNITARCSSYHRPRLCGITFHSHIYNDKKTRNISSF